jgi:hypothetical protein
MDQKDQRVGMYSHRSSGWGTIATPGYRQHCAVLQGVGFEHQYVYEWVHADSKADPGLRERWSGFDAGLCGSDDTYSINSQISENHHTKTRNSQEI